jgi:hypothetical protein
MNYFILRGLFSHGDVLAHWLPQASSLVGIMLSYAGGLCSGLPKRGPQARTLAAAIRITWQHLP